MTKPHTTLSEAVRALELPEHSARVESQNETGSMATVWMNMTHGLLRDTKIYTEDQVRALLESVAKLVEQHEAQEPVTEQIGYFWREKGRIRFCDMGDTMVFRSDRQVFPAYAQPILAATQAGDAESTTAAADAGGRGAAVEAIEFALESDDGDGFLRNWFNGEFDVCRREWPEAPDAVYIGADPLFRPPTTTRSE